MARIGPSSPTAPAARTKLPNGVSSSPASRRMGKSVPIAVVVSAIVIMTGARTNPIASRNATVPAARASESSHPAPASASGRPRMRSKSISSPARKNRKVIPRTPRKPRTPSARASPSPCGPTKLPSAISRTTIGKRRPMGSSAMRGATTAISATISSVDRLKSRRSSSPARVAGAPILPEVRLAVHGRAGHPTALSSSRWGLEDRHSPLRCRLAGQSPVAPWVGSPGTSPETQAARSILAAPGHLSRHRSCGIALAPQHPCP